MSYDATISLLIALGILQGLIFNVFVFFSRKKFDTSLTYLNLVVLALSLNNLREFVFDGNYFTEFFIHCYLSVPWHFLVVPMFYTFLIKYLNVDSRYRSFLRLSISIFLIEIAIRVGIISLSTNFDYVFQEYMIVEEMFNAAYSIFLFYFIIKLLFFDKIVIDKVKIVSKITWIKNIVSVGIVIMILWVFALIYYSYTRNAWIYDPLKIIYSILIYWMGYQGLMNSVIVTKSNNKAVHHFGFQKGFLSKPFAKRIEKLNKKHRNDYSTIEKYVCTNQRYLDPQFSLELLSNELNFSVSYISKLINEYGKYNFSDFINSLRVEKAKELLSLKDYNNYTIIAIGLECGFYSKSAFYSAFKKFTSETPSSFRKACNLVSDMS